MSSLGAFGVIAERGLFCSLYADRAAHYWHTPKAGGKVDKDNPTQWAGASAARHRASRPIRQARGRSERMFGTLQKRLPQELRLAGITTSKTPTASSRRSSGAHNARFARPAEAAGSAFVAFAGNLTDILSLQEERVVAGDNTVRYKNSSSRSRPTATAITTSRQGCACTIPTAIWRSSTDPGAWPATRPRAS